MLPAAIQPVLETGPPPASTSGVKLHRSDRRHLAERVIMLAFVGDVFVIAGMLLFSYALRFHTKLKFISIVDERINLHSYSGHLALGLSVMVVLLVNARMYRFQRISSFIYAATGIARAAFMWLLGFMALSLMLRFNPSISRFFCVIAAFEMMVGLLTWRLFLCRYLRRPHMAERLQERVMFVGWTEECEKIVSRMNKGIRHPFKIIGAIPANGGFDGGAVPGNDVPVLGEYENMREILLSEQIDVVLVIDLNMPRGELARISAICEMELVDYKIIPSAFQILLSGLHLESLQGVPVLGVSRLPLHSAFNQLVKRGVDLVGASIGLIFGAPIVLIFGWLVKRESPGPIFYKQVRVGRNGRSFNIYKIRSMRLDAEANGKAGWSTENDPRRLKIGSVIRRWNIDEIPQFWNVLTGEMSLVGPRPERPELIHDFREIIPHYNARHNIKPGITGWAQVNGFRGNTDLTERIKCDLFYIENWNLLLDFQIMMMTFLRRDNAY